MKYLLLLQCLTAIVFVAVCVPNRPPSMNVQLPNDIYYKVGELVQIPCDADGVPNPKYNWTMNNRRYDTTGNDNRIVQILHSGTIVINRPGPKDEGIFQCLAYNDLGVSTSINVNVQEAVLESFPDCKEETIHVARGHSVKLSCTSPKSKPPAVVRWVLKDYKIGTIENIKLNNRITIDLEGSLYITNVNDDDYRHGTAYVCMATNYFMRKDSFSHGTVIIPTGSSGTTDKVPTVYLWSSPKEVLGMLGQSIKIKCIFGGNPTPEVHWENKTGKIPDNRRTLSLGGQELVISQLRKSDSGNYTCYTATAMEQRQQRNINIIVKSKPYWLDGGEPHDIETRVGRNATFTCRAGGDPEPTISWYINGIRFQDASHITITEGRLFKPNDTEISFVNLRQGDAMVLQCNASNIYGYTFADFHLNVLSLSAGVIG